MLPKYEPTSMMRPRRDSCSSGRKVVTVRHTPMTFVSMTRWATATSAS